MPQASFFLVSVMLLLLLLLFSFSRLRDARCDLSEHLPRWLVIRET
jgi:hypothetical protein